MLSKRAWLLPLILAVVASLTWFFYWRLLLPPFLIFSDSAKFADIARNLVLNNGYRLSFTNFGNKMPELVGGYFSAGVTPPLYPFSLALIFKILAISDLAIVLTSGVYYLGAVIAIYFFGKKAFGELIGFLASLALIFDPAILSYATSGASESLFIFEIVLAGLLFYTRTKISQFFGFLVLLLMYLTRPSAIIFIFGFTFLFILLRFKSTGKIFKSVLIMVVIWLMTEIVFVNFSGRFFLYSPLISFLRGMTRFSPLSASTASLRGGGTNLLVGFKPFLSKFFYNLYNFYKLLPNILSPYLAAFFFLALFRWEKEREKRVFRLVVFLMVAATFIASAAFLPIYRYLHPVVPFVYLLAIEMLVWILAKMFKKKSLIWLTAIFLVMVFMSGQTIGKIFLDSRYVRAHTNHDKPPVYVQLSWLLKENTEPNDLIITNLDTWGSWYGERRTIWYPLEPEQLVPEEGEELRVDALYLTSYKMDDENYYMGENWREIFFQPEELEDEFFAENFELAGEFEVKPEETYERESATAILLKRK